MFSFENALGATLLVLVFGFFIHSSYQLAEMTPDAKIGIKSIVLSK